MFPYKNMVNLGYHGGSETADFTDHIAEMTSESELTFAHLTVRATIAASTTNHFAVTIRDGGAGGAETTAMSSILGGISAVMTALTTLNFTISEGTINDEDQINTFFDETGTATIIPQLDLELVRGLPAGAG
jgi:hypothetical protein